MGLAEDSKKVQRIVSGSEAGLRSLYAPPLATAQQDWRVLQPAAQAAGDAWVRDDCPTVTAQLATALPSHVLKRLSAPLGVTLQAPPRGLAQQRQGHEQFGVQQASSAAAVGAALAAVGPAERQRLLRNAIHAIVGASSRRQAVSGVLTAGLVKSVRYGWAKLNKAWR
jgi:translocator assembly and maintenance protein 41